MVMAAATWFALLLPLGARAAGQLVTLVDPVTQGKARVVPPGALRVAEYNDPARTAFSGLALPTVVPGQASDSEVVVTVPAGQRLVIETLSARVVLPQGQRTSQLVVFTGGARAYIPLFFMAGGGLDTFQGIAQVTLYVEPGNDVRVFWERNSLSASGLAAIGISGHFVKI
jgi:hypothetical protein